MMLCAEDRAAYQELKVDAIIPKTGNVNLIFEAVEKLQQPPRHDLFCGYLASVLGGQRMLLYEAQSETYQEIDLQTLEFKTGENCSATFRLKTHPKARFNTGGNHGFGSLMVERV
jgi:hypothetical protein